MSLESSPKTFFQNNVSSLSNINYKKPLNSLFSLFPINSTPSKENSQTSKINFPDNSYYEGEINKTNNLPNGVGNLFYYNGEVFFGNFKNGKKEGLGEYHYKDGTIYIGSWKNDKKNGKGIYICEENNWIFFGMFNDDIPGIGNFEKYSEIYGKKINDDKNEGKYDNNQNNFNKLIMNNKIKFDNNKKNIENSIKRISSKKIIKCDEFFFDYCPVIKNLNFNM